VRRDPSDSGAIRLKAWESTDRRALGYFCQILKMGHPNLLRRTFFLLKVKLFFFCIKNFDMGALKRQIKQKKGKKKFIER
jgi:hypothetical protein